MGSTQGAADEGCYLVPYPPSFQIRLDLRSLDGRCLPEPPFLSLRRRSNTDLASDHFLGLAPRIAAWAKKAGHDAT